MGNTIISSLLFQPPTPANELDYFGNINLLANAAASESGPSQSAHNDSSNEASYKSKGHIVRGGGSAKNQSSGSSSRQQSQQQQVVANPHNCEPTLHYIWLLSATHPIPIPALHIRHPDPYGVRRNSSSGSGSSSPRPSTIPSNNRYTLLYSHGNAEDIGLLAKFLTDISKLLQVDILVYDYSGYGVSVDRSAVLRFYAVWGGQLEEWKRWRKEHKSATATATGGGEGMREETEEEEGKRNNKNMPHNNGGVSYSMDVFMAPMVFPKGTRNTAAAAASNGGGEVGKKETTTSSSSSATAPTTTSSTTPNTTSSSSSSSTKLNLPDNIYVCGDELDFIDEDATTIATARSDHDPRTTSTSPSNRGRTRTSSSEPRDNSLLDIDNDEDYFNYYDDDTAMPSLAATCYDNSTIHGDDYDEDEDEVSLFTCGASCNEVEHSSIVDDGRLDNLEEEEGDVMMRDDDVSTTLSSSYHHRYRSSSQPPPSSSSPRSVISGATGTTTSTLSSSCNYRRRRPNRQNSINIRTTPLTPKQKRQALLRKHKWTMPSPSEEQCYGDIWLAYNYLLQVQEIPSKHVLLYGKSVGSGPTCWLAQRTCCQSVGGGGGGGNRSRSRSNSNDSGLEGGGVMYEDVRDDGNVDYRDEKVGGSSGGGNKSSSSSSCGDDIAPGGVILHSPFLSVIRVVLDMGFTTVGDLFPNIDRVKDISCPTYIIHGTEDEIVPYYHGQGLFNALPGTSKAVPFWANGAGHNNIEMEMPTAYIKRLMQFIRQCDRLNYPAGELLRTRAFSSGSHGSGTSTTTPKRGSSSQQEMDGVVLNANANRKYYTRQMSMPNLPASKQRKKKGALVRTSSSTQSNSNSASTTMAANTTMLTNTAPKRRQGRSHRKNNMETQQQQQQQKMHHSGKYYQSQHRSVRDHYPSVETNLSTDAAMCGIQPSVEPKYHTPYPQQQQQTNYY